MRVVIACDWFLKYAASQGAGLVRQGADVVLLCRTHANEFNGDERERELVLESARRAGVRVLEVPGRVSDVQVARALACIRRKVARFKPQILHAHEGVDPRALLLVPPVPTVLTIHDPVLHPGQPVARAPKRWFLHSVRQLWRGRATVFVVHSECLGEHLAPRKSQRSVAIAHGVKIRDEPLPLPQQPVVGFFGRLASYKGLDVLAKAMPQVWSARPELQLLVSGWGNCKLGLDDYRVRVDRRYIPESEIGHFFKRTSLMVLPYTQASQSGVGSMAAGYGVPVIASNVGGLPDLTLDRSYVFSVGDDAELAAAILRHVDDGADVRRRVLEQVAAPRSWEAVGARLLELYTTLLDDS